MKLLFTLDNTTKFGGGDYSIFKFAEYLSYLGHEITIFTTTENNYIKEIKEKAPNIKFFYRNGIKLKIRGIGLLNRVWDKIYTRIKIMPYVKKNHHYDFVIGFHTGSTQRAHTISTKFSIPCVSFVFETPDWMEKQLKDRWHDEYKGRFKKLWDKTYTILKDIPIILANSEMTKNENERWLDKKLNGVIYPGLDLNKNFIDKKIIQKNQIIYIGRLNAYKNIDLLIRAVSKIKEAPKLIICGEGEEKNNLKNLIEELGVDCEFKGQVTDQNKWKFIQESMFMVFPTSFEGFGMPPMESLFCNRPCLCSDIPILKEVYGNSVEYFKENDEKDLAEKIIKLIKDSEYRIKRGILGHKYIIKKYSWKKSAEKIQTILTNFKNENK